MLVSLIFKREFGVNLVLGSYFSQVMDLKSGWTDIKTSIWMMVSQTMVTCSLLDIIAISYSIVVMVEIQFCF